MLTFERHLKPASRISKGANAVILYHTFRETIKSRMKRTYKARDVISCLVSSINFNSMVYGPNKSCSRKFCLGTRAGNF